MSQITEQPFPLHILEEIRSYPGNEKCCDCFSLDTDWASISHGTLICLECAGKHRSLGVQISFVRSISMDTWSPMQIEMLRQGGNAQIRRFFKKIEIELSSSIQVLYSTKGAEHYRLKLKERSAKIISGEITSEKRGSRRERKLSEERITPVHSPKASLYHKFTVSFKEGPMGMTLTKEYSNNAVISKLVPNGNAQLAGVLVGDFVTGVAGGAVTNYDEIMLLVPLLPRPLEIQFCRRKSLLSTPSFHWSDDSNSKSPHVNSEESVSSRNPSVDNQLASSDPLTSSQSSPQRVTESLVTNEILRNDEGADKKDVERSRSDSENDDMDKSSGDIETSTIDYSAFSPLSSPLLRRSPTPIKRERLLEAGVMVKVLQDSTKWTMAVIKRLHKDGTLKVIYRDGSIESHISPARIALTANTLRSIGALPPDLVDAYDECEESPSLHHQQQQQQYLAEVAMRSIDEALDNIDYFHPFSEFVDEEELDAWIATDLGSLSSKDLAVASQAKSMMSYGAKNEVIVFEESPFGLTLRANDDGAPEVIQVKEGGQAERKGVQVGDILCEIDAMPVNSYEEAMLALPKVKFPTLLSFKKGLYNVVYESSEVILQNSKVLVERLKESKSSVKLTSPSVLLTSSDDVRNLVTEQITGSNINIHREDLPSGLALDDKIEQSGEAELGLQLENELEGLQINN